jgi:aarF domain-containing kinase
VDTKPIVVALEAALPDVLNAAVGELNFKNVISKLGDVFYKFPFSLPPFYIAIIRCLGVLEGLAIQIDKEFRIISDAYPYIASRLLTDSSTELQSALEQVGITD